MIIKFIFTTFIWAFSCGLLGYFAGAIHDGHAWEVMPVMGAFYGLISGLIFSILNLFPKYRKTLEKAESSALTGLISSIVPATLLFLLADSIEILILGISAGPAVGIFTFWVYNSVFDNYNG